MSDKQDTYHTDLALSFGERLHIVVARYKEQLEWLNNEPFNLFPVTLYNKGGDDNYTKTPNIVKEVVLPNYGLEVHSFLYHIINNYDNLANITVFLPVSYTHLTLPTILRV